jgi:hypothetical protein
MYSSQEKIQKVVGTYADVSNGRHPSNAGMIWAIHLQVDSKREGKESDDPTKESCDTQRVQARRKEPTCICPNVGYPRIRFSDVFKFLVIILLLQTNCGAFWILE